MILDSTEYLLDELSECIVRTSDVECCYLLTAISNMALSRYINDVDFIKTVTVCLFKVRSTIDYIKACCICFDVFLIDRVCE